MNKFIRKNRLLFSLLTILILGLVNLSSPFLGDQAFFLIGAKKMDLGYILYKDYWDIKQPGIFCFYLVAGKLFGFNEIGIHLFELIYWLLFAFLFIWFLRKYIFKHKEILAYLTCVILIGSYYCLGWVLEFTQVESLVLFPLLLVVIFNTIYLESNKYGIVWLLLSGFAGGVVLFFKLIFLPLICFFWLVTLIQSYCRLKKYWNESIRFLIIPLGIFIFWTPFLVYCLNNNITQLIYNTFFIYPPQIVHNSPIFNARFFESISGFFPKIAFFLPFAVIGAVKFWKEKFVFDMVIWFILAGFIIFLQRTSGFIYQFQLLYPPVIILSIFGLSYIVENFRFKKINLLRLSPKRLLVVAYLIVNAPSMLTLGYKLNKLAQFNYLITKGDRQSYILSNPSNNRSYHVVQMVKSDLKKTTTIFTSYNSLIYYYAGKTQITQYNGWGFLLPNQGSLLLKELKILKPDFIFLANENINCFKDPKTSIVPWIKSNYNVHSTCSEGSWYVSIW